MQPSFLHGSSKLTWFLNVFTGFAGCYLYDSQMENFSNFSQTEVEVSTTPESSTIILCFKECLNNPSKYAGLKLTNKARIPFLT